MFSHIVVGSNDIDKAQRFYDAIFGVLRVAPGGRDDRKGRLYYRDGHVLYMVTRPINDKPASFANGGTIGFSAENAEQVQAWYAAGLANGGTSCEGLPGLRDDGAGKRHLAYLRDPDGNKLCAVYWMAA